MGNMLSQTFPPTATFTETECPDQTGKVFIVTGSTAGVGKELAQILYSKNAKVYIAARSSEKAEKVITAIKASFPDSKGELVYLHLDLDDLTTIKASADEFLSKETKLDVLWNNAGVMVPAQGSKTKQGYELQLGTNNVAPFLFTKLLTPILVDTAKANAPGTTRVVWVSSSAVEMSPKGGVDLNNLDYKVDKGAWAKYGVSKAGNLLHSHEFARRYGKDGVISIALNPGNLKSELQRHLPSLVVSLMSIMLYTPIHGAYTELFAGLSPTVTPEQNGAWVIPWGRFGVPRKDLVLAAKEESEGGLGTAKKFWEWSEEQVKEYL
jgi:retinol dehydrogenase-12